MCPHAIIRVLSCCQGWAELLPNRIAVVVSVFLILVSLDTLFFMAPSLKTCLIRFKGAISIQHSLRFARSRNILFFLYFIPFCLIADRFGFYRPSFPNSFPSEWGILFTMAAAALFFLFRLVLYLIMKPSGVDSDTYYGAISTVHVFMVIYVIAALPLFFLLYTLHVPDIVTGRILFCLLGIVYLIGTVRAAQIFHSVFSGLQTFLYLCTLEFVPLALLIVSAVVF